MLYFKERLTNYHSVDKSGQESLNFREYVKEF